jgi:hypothetical protein
MLSFKVLFYPLNICNVSKFYRHIFAASVYSKVVFSNAKRKMANHRQNE